MTIKFFLEALKKAEFSEEFLNTLENETSFRHLLLSHFRKEPNRDLALQFLQKLKTARRKDLASGDSLMLACLILGLHKQQEDALMIWNTKHMDFDASCYLDAELVLFNGFHQTVQFFRESDTEEAKKALKYFEGDEKEYENLGNYFSEENVPWWV